MLNQLRPIADVPDIVSAERVALIVGSGRSAPNSWVALAKKAEAARAAYPPSDARHVFAESIYHGAQVAHQMGIAWRSAGNDNLKSQAEFNTRYVFNTGYMASTFVAAADRLGQHFSSSNIMRDPTAKILTLLPYTQSATRSLDSIRQRGEPEPNPDDLMKVVCAAVESSGKRLQEFSKNILRTAYVNCTR